MTSFGGLGSTFGGVNGISELGHVFGTSADLFSSHAWVIRDGSAESYSDLARILYIDTAGRIYGLDQQWQAAIVEGGTITRVGDLIDGASGWTFWMDAANERGDILTSACYAGNCDYTVMLTAVPEPSTYAMLLLGGLALYGHARRRRA
ncbi:PEP-CTERM sorting domain-containing protein [Pseudoduganella umbonata]|uniref:PEP-CTERM sorting domain-containing protein n=2 Tax=Pseudoduganella umbonata TaxID=864828 RepID=A0ABX5UTS0_9BURK|nr:PEP-CTERM sorting domain-containing protein [Pseudoduganella umbonata]